MKAEIDEKAIDLDDTVRESKSFMEIDGAAGRQQTDSDVLYDKSAIYIANQSNIRRQSGDGNTADLLVANNKSNLGK